MTQKLESQIARLEWRMDSTEKDINELNNEFRELKAEISKMSKIMFQIKWLVIGSICGIIFEAFGFMEILKVAL